MYLQVTVSEQPTVTPLYFRPLPFLLSILTCSHLSNAKLCFLPGVTMSNMTWRLVTGCCRSPGGLKEFLIPRHSCNGGCLGLSYICIRALLASSAWIFIAFMNASYYACAVSKRPCQADEDTPVLDVSDRAFSQSIGLMILVFGLLILLIGMFLWRMCSVYTYEHQRFADIYRDLERKAFIERSRREAEARIEESLDRFFAQEELCCRNPEDWDKVNQTWLGVSFVGSDYAADYGYTTLHEWSIANEHLDIKSKTGEERQPSPPMSTDFKDGPPQPLVQKLDMVFVNQALEVADELNSHTQQKQTRKQNKKKRKKQGKEVVPKVSE
ncbi:calcium homeostasis modulator protein 6-like [Ptychodera flava]|uniref:calcium homeostasis modulator protein 6-like n=1 Tax=Ptychodera flava TaxID=63121 RepID=UPI003969E6CA